ncbi:response regulator transcription factor [Paenibacillus cymbidii]|uniref:response regulator transcription factor n=1 Tax=Paenibacillus cymbidii TaxID=1639034 RepID=UPI0010812EA6|nr:response regulator transcription factor [Paenibacillus cymbidii]
MQTSPKQLLVVDDDPAIVQLIDIYLANEGYTVFKAADGEEALDVLARETVQLVILDVMMPKLDGIEVCRRIRAERGIPILMLSAKAEDMDKILGLATGADDYMVKPFNPLELLARVKSLLRRSYSLNPQLQQAADPGVIRLQSLVIDKTNHAVTVEGREVTLTSLEFNILYLLASHPGRVFSAEDIYTRVWGDPYYQSHNTVMVHISKLRDKLEKETEGAKLIQTVWGVGYKIDR